MARSEIQKKIIPRNWLFGRLAYIYANLYQIVRNDKFHFSPGEMEKLEMASKLLREVLDAKKENSELLKRIVNGK